MGNELRECKECGKLFKRSKMAYTRDCHGFPFRLVCFHCQTLIMNKGYDGQYYPQDDICEQTEPDW